ncbi:hypothetical protein D0861_02763 [Hortaea werneckii]|uniref:tRNA(Ile)-lysidine synthetase n=1 Tax=Hortaea werneckii TaxID=91943 RepID=A0A3M7FT39_HORWE|nr:hypothetical protein D0861_02763 [Hortaea werneckii]
MQHMSQNIRSLSSLITDFQKSLRSTWTTAGSRPLLGLAISGGVDSMALASLCHQFGQASPHHPSFVGFIVDHKLRDGSTEEAQKVAESLDRLQISPRVLTLDWSGYGPTGSLPNLESIARRLRYQALGNACRKEAITSLLVAHHADDQAETAMLRVLGNYRGNGLRGIKRSTPIPECEGIYGVNQSGQPRSWASLEARGRDRGSDILIEDGGLSIERPLLAFTKSQLTAYCHEQGIQWFEDHTNADRTYTLRNTVRHLLNSSELPHALRKPRLHRLIDVVAAREERSEELAQSIYSESKITLDPRTGQASITLPGKMSYSAMEDASAVAILARKFLRLCSPATDLKLQELDGFVRLIRNDDELSKGVADRCQLAGVDVLCGADESQRRYLKLQRSLPSKQERLRKQLILFKRHSDLAGSEWQLWDNRYWIWMEMHKEANYTEVKVRFLEPGDLALIRENSDHGQRKLMKSSLSAVPGVSRYSLPAIVATRTSQDGGIDRDVEQIVALPTLDWSAPGWQRWQAKAENGSTSVTTPNFWDVRYHYVEPQKAVHGGVPAPGAVAVHGNL